MAYLMLIPATFLSSSSFSSPAKQATLPYQYTHTMSFIPPLPHNIEMKASWTLKKWLGKKKNIFSGAVKTLSNPLPTVSLVTRFALSIYGEIRTRAIHIFVSKLKYNFWQFFN